MGGGKFQFPGFPQLTWPGPAPGGKHHYFGFQANSETPHFSCFAGLHIVFLFIPKRSEFSSFLCLWFGFCCTPCTVFQAWSHQLGMGTGCEVAWVKLPPRRHAPKPSGRRAAAGGAGRPPEVAAAGMGRGGPGPQHTGRPVAVRRRGGAVRLR